VLSYVIASVMFLVGIWITQLLFRGYALDGEERSWSLTSISWNLTADSQDLGPSVVDLKGASKPTDITSHDTPSHATPTQDTPSPASPSSASPSPATPSQNISSQDISSQATSSLAAPSPAIPTDAPPNDTSIHDTPKVSHRPKARPLGDFNPTKQMFDVPADIVYNSAGPRPDQVILLTASDGKGHNSGIENILESTAENRKKFCEHHGYINHFINISKYDLPDVHPVSSSSNSILRMFLTRSHRSGQNSQR
jgi:hypothetical protein